MVHTFSVVHTFPYPFSVVSLAFWRKYPNVQAPHVKQIDIYDRKLIKIPRATTEELVQNEEVKYSENAAAAASNPTELDTCLVTNRIIGCESALPSWMTSLGISSSAFAVETTIVNPRTKEMVVKSRNLTGSSLMIVEESCIYRPSKADPNHTEYSQTAKISAFLPFFSQKCEQYSFQSMTAKSQNGLQTIENICEKIKSNGMVSLLDEWFKPIKQVAGQNIK
jgi:hypothetical protein